MNSTLRNCIGNGRFVPHIHCILVDSCSELNVLDCGLVVLCLHDGQKEGGL